MRAWLPYLLSAVVHSGFLATLHWACSRGLEPAQFALQQGCAQIELLVSLPRDAAEAPAVQIASLAESTVEPSATVEKQQAELPTRPVEVAESSLLDAQVEIAAALPAAPAEEPETAAPTQPNQPVERQRAERALTTATPAAWQAPAAVGATVDELPQKLPRNPAPQYPAAAYTARQEGVVLVRVQVAANGAVADARLEESCGHALLDQSALETVRQWRFTPARRAGLAVAHEILVPVRFQLSARRPA